MNHLKNKCIFSIMNLWRYQLELALVRLESKVWRTIYAAIIHKLTLTFQNLVTSMSLTYTVTKIAKYSINLTLILSNISVQQIHLKWLW